MHIRVPDILVYEVSCKKQLHLPCVLCTSEVFMISLTSISRVAGNATSRSRMFNVMDNFFSLDISVFGLQSSSKSFESYGLLSYILIVY